MKLVTRFLIFKFQSKISKERETGKAEVHPALSGFIYVSEAVGDFQRTRESVNRFRSLRGMLLTLLY